MKTEISKNFFSRSAMLLVLAILILFLLEITTVPAERPAFVSAEVHFTDRTESGMHVLPASCSSSPSYYHYGLSATADGRGYTSATGQTEYGAYKYSTYICVTNTSGSSYFVPANSAAEMSNFKTTARDPWTSAGVGSTLTTTNGSHGGAATGFGAGGGGASWYGGNGGAGLFGGGGGGAAGNSGVTQTGGAGGQGVVVIQTSPNVLRRILMSGTNWTVPSGVTSVTVWAVGGGGGGAGSTNNNSGAGGGGGAGGVSYRTYTVNPGDTATYSLGAAGAIGSGAANGGAGGTTTFTLGGVTITATGGAGGIYNTNANAAGGTGSGGTGASTGGAGLGAFGNVGGGGGGGIGGGVGVNGGSYGDNGALGVDVASLRAAVHGAIGVYGISAY